MDRLTDRTEASGNNLDIGASASEVHRQRLTVGDEREYIGATRTVLIDRPIDAVGFRKNRRSKPTFYGERSGSRLAIGVRAAGAVGRRHHSSAVIRCVY